MVSLRRVRISAKADYALRAAAELATANGGPVKGEQLATRQDIPPKFLENILGDVRHAGLIRSQRGAEGGYWLQRPANEITLAEIVRAVEGPLATVRGQRPEDVGYVGAAEQLQRVWIAVRHNLRAVLEEVTVADLAAGQLPKSVARLADDPDSWVTR
jgi:Rrf2 family protein